MIRVTIELVPLGVLEPQHLGTIEIANDASGDKVRGNYYADLYDKGHRHMKRVFVRHFPRKQLLAIDLLYRVLREARGAKNP